MIALLPVVLVSRFRGPWLKWWSICLLCYFIFSVVLLIGVNPKCDLQDSLIQHVRFIPSFAIWSVFIGLGLLMIIDWIDGFLNKEDS